MDTVLFLLNTITDAEFVLSETVAIRPYFKLQGVKKLSDMRIFLAGYRSFKSYQRFSLKGMYSKFHADRKSTTSDVRF